MKDEMEVGLTTDDDTNQKRGKIERKELRKKWGCEYALLHEGDKTG